MEQIDIFSADKQELNWKAFIEEERHTPYFKSLKTHIDQRAAAGLTIYPPQADIFNAFAYTPFSKVSVVILGQDPYHGPGQAHGLCFSVAKGVPLPPSLKNIFKELRNDLQIEPPSHGCLEQWARQGVLLLNTSLTVEAGAPQSHGTIGWEIFTDKVISLLNEKSKGLVFLLWGAHAQKKGKIIDTTRHHVLTSTHPSPLSAHRGFLGCKHFSKTNELLRAEGRPEIDWQIS